ncbi:MAG: threonine--tRNA ligase [Candidatus Nealsonbacteria bacterium CG01_land_8_20_14_3_00_12]|uniref:Threonine--tRNA ligase n=2 Tax=Candidatus Nealsoniibacteriota TaxID=1817911 RepID=A0A2M7EBT9_9BACT|nr:MAG: threonine--tRNA ligase [Candidatus Nealsonbacteria bacterium CG01_land_8_20_14_3_00_12]PJA83913.1 MAG: threonine--tRNA ligase [Candidatus Nealsonbacteria bacterium CG_4_9_14_3_um_filter_37_29]
MKIETIRHSLAHIMAAAVQELYPETCFGIGPAIENGFYYDFDLKRSISPEDLPKIEEKMRELIKKNISFKKETVMRRSLITLFDKQPYKLELIKEFPGRKLTIYKSGEFVDLCAGPHVKSTLQLHSGQAKEIIDAFKLTKIAGAYWRGSEKNPMLTRIYGVAFKTKKELESYLQKEAEAEKRDHRVLGQKLELFSFDEEIGAGLPLWHPKGAQLRRIIENFITEELLKAGYQLVNSPHIGKEDLFQTSGHLDFYKENMYSPIEIEKEKYYLKPMNCPFHIKIYNSKIRSYRDLPIRLAELGTVYRYEKSGVLHGLVRVRGFTQDDAHIFCTPEDLSKELISLLKFAKIILKTFGFKEFEITLTTRPEKYVGTLKIWEKASNALKYALNQVGLTYQIESKEAPFYGPSVNLKIKDSLGRPWQCTTIQVDFNLPEKFNLNYIDQKGKKKRPIMVHRAILGSIERFIGVLLENYAGALPLWLSPEQIWVIPVGARHEKYAREINEKLNVAGFRCQLKEENETVSKKIRDGEIQKIPYLLVVGDKEMKTNSVRVRERGKGDIGKMKLKKFLEKVKIEIDNKK